MIYGYNVSAEAYLRQLEVDLGLSSTGQELVSASATVSDALSMVVAGQFLLDKYGRRASVSIGACFCVLGSVMGALSSTLTGLVIARLVQGVGNGVSILSVPLLVSECAPQERRGLLVSMFQFGVILGFMAPIVVQLAFADWKWTIGLGGVPGFMLLLVLFLIWDSAESKSWLHARASVFMAVADDEVEETSSDTDSEAGLPDFYQGVLLAVVLAFTNNASDAIIFYGPNIVQMAGVGDEESLWTSLLLAAVNIPAVVLVLMIVSKFSRRAMLLTGLICVILCYFLIGITFLVNPDHIAGLIVFGFLALMVGYQVGPGTIFLMVLPEMFLQRDRASGVMFGTAAMSIFSILCNGSMLSTIEALGGGSSDDQKRIGAGRTFLIYSVAYFFCFIFLYRTLPETKNRAIVHTM